jgi:hypothetical protein
MNLLGHDSLLAPGILFALTSALLFGASTPLAKLLLGTVDPWMLAGLLYLGSRLGLGMLRLGRRLIGVPAAQAPLRTAPKNRVPRPAGQTTGSLPALMSRTSSFHSVCDSRTVFASSPIVTPWSVISTSGQATQSGQRVNLIDSIWPSLMAHVRHPTICSHYYPELSW